ncbi:MAG: hypothetical protein OEU32_00635 [Acidimicrobiia bacterium]|nr:hypothetical protein [Acidimicrobiia bacterium]
MDSTLQQAWEQPTAPGAAFAWSTTDIRGVPTRTYNAAPPTMRAIWEASVTHGDADYIKERLAKFKVPAEIWFLDDALPRNANGKFLKRELRNRLLG